LNNHIAMQVLLGLLIIVQAGAIFHYGPAASNSWYACFPQTFHGSISNSKGVVNKTYELWSEKLFRGICFL